MFEQTRAASEIIGGGGSLLLEGDGARWSDALQPFEGQAQCVYVDPPFMTGDAFTRRRFYGEQGWRTGVPYPVYPAYSDKFPDRETYLRFLRGLAENGKRLLGDTGLFCMHLDWRSSAWARLVCDEVFGEERFLNEIIWAYESGGRAKRYFSRKHDVILVYGRSRKYRFDLTRVPVARESVRRNHMKRRRDDSGRAYRSIRSGGREYRYYDDAPAYPGDVWSDISHLQQRDPERTGYATQKPVRLVERLLLPTVAAGDLVCDLCCGSGTTLAAASRLDCRFLGVDESPEALAIARSRLTDAPMTLSSPCDESPAPLEGSYDPATGMLLLTGFHASHPAFPATRSAMDALEGWSAGRLTDGVMRTEQTFQRSHAHPDLPLMTLLSPGEGDPAVIATDASGRRRAYVWRV